MIVTAAGFFLAACSEQSPPSQSPLAGDACSGKDTVCAGDLEHVLYCDGDVWKDGVACEEDEEEGGFVCDDAGQYDASIDLGVARCGRDPGRDVAFGIEGGSCTARETVGVCTTDPRRFLGCSDGVLADPCPPGFALPMDCADIENTETWTRSIECVDAGQRCAHEGEYHVIHGRGAFRCDGGLLVEVDPELCVEPPMGADDHAPYTHLLCGSTQVVPVAEAGEPCDPSEEAACTGDRASLLTCEGGVWVETACETRCVWPVEYDPPFCE